MSALVAASAVELVTCVPWPVDVEPGRVDSATHRSSSPAGLASFRPGPVRVPARAARR